jgi:hypothetical protein
MKIKILTGMCAFILSGIAVADCPSSLNTEKMVECITVGGAGENYQDWQKGVRTAASTEEPEEEPDCD